MKEQAASPRRDGIRPCSAPTRPTAPTAPELGWLRRLSGPIRSRPGQQTAARGRKRAKAGHGETAMPLFPDHAVAKPSMRTALLASWETLEQQLESPWWDHRSPSTPSQSWHRAGPGPPNLEGTRC